MKREPERTCIGCRRVLKKSEVIRLVAGPAGVLIDYREKLQGRAAYVCPNRECIGKALSNETLSRSLHERICLPDKADFLIQLANAIRAKVRSLLSIALKAGKTAIGVSAVQDALDKGGVELLLYAADLSDGTRDKVALRCSHSVRTEILFTRDEYGLIFNREFVGVTALLDKGLANAVWSEIQRLKGLIKDTN